MIATLFLKFIIGLLWLLDVAMPDWAFPQFIINGFEIIVESALEVNGFIPMADILFCITLIFSFHVARYTINIGAGFLSLIRGGGNVKT